MTSNVSRRHLLFLNQIFRSTATQSFCQDVELKCSDGSLLFNKLIVGLVFPQLRNSMEYQLSISDVVLMPEFSIDEVFEKFNVYFSEKELANKSDSCSYGNEGYSFVATDTVEEVITELVVDETIEKKIVWLNNDILPLSEKTEIILVDDKTKLVSSETSVFTSGEESVGRDLQSLNHRTIDGKVNDMAKKEVARNYSCGTCGRVFRFKTQLQNNENTHAKPFKCGVCTETFSEDNKLASHELNSHGQLINGAGGVSNSLMKCSFCPKVFPARSQLVLHERTHTKERPFQCSQCEKKFSVKCNLMAHERIHFGVSKRYMCRHPPCNRKFSHTTERKDHETIHTGDKPYMCPTCGERYRRNANLWRHKRKCGTNGNTATNIKGEKSQIETKYEVVLVDQQM